MTQTMTYCCERCRRVCVTELFSNQRMGEPRRPELQAIGEGAGLEKSDGRKFRRGDAPDMW